MTNLRIHRTPAAKVAPFFGAGLLAALAALGGFLLTGCGQKSADSAVPTVSASADTSSGVFLNGAGATFPNPIYSRWMSEYSKVDGATHLNYQPIGSGGGKIQIIKGTVDFGASDSPMSDSELASAPGKILHIPTVAGADAITYNLPANPDLKLDGETLAEIFLGKITRWDDPKIAAQNPSVALPALDIVVVHRSDGSGTTFIFTDFLSSVSHDWAANVGRDASVHWPVGLGAKGNEGVTEQVKQLPGAIGYVELIYAMEQKLPYASMKNSAGNYILPSVKSVTAALAGAAVPDDFRFSMVNPPGPEAYPIAGATWLLVYQQQADPAKGRKLVEFLKWTLTQGQTMAESLAYAPLPDSLDKRVLAEIDTIKY